MLFDKIRHSSSLDFVEHLEQLENCYVYSIDSFDKQIESQIIQYHVFFTKVNKNSTSESGNKFQNYSKYPNIAGKK